MKHVKLFEEFANEPVNEGLKDMLQVVKDLARKMAKDYAEDASEFISNPEALAKINPEKEVKKAEAKVANEVSVNEGLMDKIKDYIDTVTYVTGAGSLLSAIGIAGAYINYVDNSIYEWYYSKIRKLADWEIHELMQKKYGVEADISQWEMWALKYAFMAFFIMFVVSFAAKLITKKRR